MAFQHSSIDNSVHLHKKTLSRPLYSELDRQHDFPEAISLAAGEGSSIDL
jgi:hypothetical protein